MKSFKSKKMKAFFFVAAIQNYNGFFKKNFPARLLGFIVAEV